MPDTNTPDNKKAASGRKGGLARQAQIRAAKAARPRTAEGRAAEWYARYVQTYAHVGGLVLNVKTLTELLQSYGDEREREARKEALEPFLKISGNIKQLMDSPTIRFAWLECFPEDELEAIANAFGISFD